MRIRQVQLLAFVTLLSILLAQHAVGQTVQSSEPKKPDTQVVHLYDAATAAAKYQELSEAAKAGNLDIDWFALRLAARCRDNSGPIMTQSNMFQSLNAQKYDEALKAALSMEAYNFADGDAHYVASIAYNQQGKAADAEREKQLVLAIARSIMHSGDGKSAETAWLVVWPDEEYFLFHLMGYMPKQQSLAMKNGHEYDQMVVTDRKTGAEVTFWFNTDTDFMIMNQELGGNTKKNE